MKRILILANLVLFTLTFGQEKRVAFTLEIAADETHQYSAEIPESPYFVKDKILQMYCGEKLLVECELNKDVISSMKIVKENRNPEKTIEIEFSQNSEERNNISTMLIVKNPFDKALNYNALMFTPISQVWKKTSIIPIQPKLMNFETWPHSIITLVLDEWRLE
jgi:hypothetical protein